MIIYAAPCPDCSHRVRLEVDTDRHGHSLPDKLVEGCEHERKRRGVCKHCPRPVWGAVGRSIYCAGCRKRATRRSHRESARRKYERDPDAHRERARRYRQRNPEWANRQIERLRETKGRSGDRPKPGSPAYEAELERRREQYRTDPEYRAKIKAKQAAYRERKRAERESTHEQRRMAA